MVPELRLLITLGLGALFLVAAAAKLANPAEFRAAVLAYAAVPRAAARYVAAIVPIAELWVGIALLSGYQARAALLVAGALLLVFALAMMLALRKGRRPDCGCGVGRRRPISAGLAARNVVLAAVAGWTSAQPTAGLRELAATSGPYASGNGVAALITLLLALVGTQLAVQAWRVALALRSSPARTR